VVLQLTIVCAGLPTYRVQITHCSRAGEWTEAIEQYSHTKPPCHASVDSTTAALAGTLVQPMDTGACREWAVSPNRFHKSLMIVRIMMRKLNDFQVPKQFNLQLTNL